MSVEKTIEYDGLDKEGRGRRTVTVTPDGATVRTYLEGDYLLEEQKFHFSDFTSLYAEHMADDTALENDR
jgi:hypothetical protein